MSSGLSPQKLKELKVFLDQIKLHPQLLHLKELSFFKEFLEHFGARIPEDESRVHVEEEEVKTPERAPKAEPEVVHMEEDEPIIDEGLMAPDNDPPLEAPDLSAEITDDMIDSANSLKGEAMQAQREGKLQESVDLLTKAIKANPRSGILYASRGQVLLDMKKPNAAIRDCDVAISKSPDSAKPYKVRAKAHRALGHYEQALKDIHTGQKLDWDETSNKVEHEIKEFVDKINANKKKEGKETTAPTSTPTPAP